MPSGAMRRSAGPFTGAPPTMGLTAITRSRRATSASRTPGTARIGPIEITGFDGQITMVSAVRSASSTPGRRMRVLGAVEADRHDRRLGALAHEPRLHRELLGVAAVAPDSDARAHPVVGHRDEPQARGPTPA